MRAKNYVLAQCQLWVICCLQRGEADCFRFHHVSGPKSDCRRQGWATNGHGLRARARIVLSTAEC